MSYELRSVSSPEDWLHLHAIRRSALFTPGRHSFAYDENHPDDRAPGNLPFLLLADSRPVGVVRLDLRGEIAIVRLVAIADEEQGKGHGRKLDRLIEAEARRRHVRQLRLNAAPAALGYYEKMGWRRANWDPDELVGLAENCIQMSKELESD
ncbi:GNAT family N-acetyltransferase [Phyllobacterium salinisoli]|uniref:GNAT family N-acetyltransferase n=1 Tax=Phyllobacterium salinisoli TaxID=1899321 RepID=UPI001FDFE87B|nr:GNAT family N-acetyltransferase [Phyllobacterium salinisoli]